MGSWNPAPATIWAITCVLTVLSVAQVQAGWWRWATPVLVVLIAAVKARLIILHYMEARHARAHWRLLYGAWNSAVAAVIIIGYLLTAE